MILNFVSIVTF